MTRKSRNYDRQRRKSWRQLRASTKKHLYIYIYVRLHWHYPSLLIHSCCPAFFLLHILFQCHLLNWTFTDLQWWPWFWLLLCFLSLLVSRKRNYELASTPRPAHKLKLLSAPLFRMPYALIRGMLQFYFGFISTTVLLRSLSSLSRSQKHTYTRMHVAKLPVSLLFDLYFFLLTLYIP